MTYANATNITGLLDLFDYSNQVTSYWFAPSVLIMVFVVLFFSMKSTFSNSRCFAGAIFVTFLVAAFMRVYELLGNFPLLVTIMFLFVSVIWLRLDQ